MTLTYSLLHLLRRARIQKDIQEKSHAAPPSCRAKINVAVRNAHTHTHHIIIRVLLCKDSCVQSRGNLFQASSFTQQLTAFHLGGHCEYEYPKFFCLEFPDTFSDKLKYFTSMFTFLLWWVHVLIVMEDFKRLGNWVHAGKSKDLTEIRWAFPKRTVPGATGSIKLP